MAKKKLRLLRRVPPMIGICEECLAQFKSIFTGAIPAETEIRVRFAAHKCLHPNRCAATSHLTNASIELSSTRGKSSQESFRHIVRNGPPASESLAAKRTASLSSNDGGSVANAVYLALCSCVYFGVERSLRSQ